MKELFFLRAGNPNPFAEQANRKVTILHITGMCDFHCSYCVAAKAWQKGHWTRDILFRNLDWIKKDGQTDEIMFFGGEPTLHPDFLDAVRKATGENNCSLSMMSNGGKGVAFFENIYKIAPNFKPTISIHFEKFNTEKIIDLLNLICDMPSGGNFIVMLPPGLESKAITFLHTLKQLIINSNSTISCLLIRDPATKYRRLLNGYSTEDWNLHDELNSISKNKQSARVDFVLEYRDALGNKYFIKDHYDKLMSFGLLSLPKVNCWIGSWRCVFDKSGLPRVNPCTPIYGRINEFGSQPLFRSAEYPILCNLKKCWCYDYMGIKREALGVNVQSFQCESSKLALEEIYINEDGRIFLYE